jgi:autotransporter-associated beta strand protein
VLTRTGSYSAPTTNYILTQPSLTANITARNLTITANAVSKEFGTALSSPVIGSTAFTSSGLQNGETIGSVTITYGSGALAGDAPNTYVNSVTPSAATGGTFNASNYSITYVSANLVVFARNLWDSNGAAAGSGNTGGNWSDNKWTDNTSGTSATGAFTNNSTPTFSAGTDGIGTFGVAVDVNRNVNGIAFEEGAVTLSAGAGALALTGSSVTVASGVTGTIAATLQGTSGLNKLGAGNLVLSGSNSFTGGITVTAGVLEAGGNTPNALNNQNASIGSGAILRFNANSDFQQPNQSITGAGTIEQNGLRISPLGNVNGHTGDLVINGGDYDCRTGQAVGNTSRVIINSSGKMTLAVAGDETIGTIEGTGELNFFGAGVPRLFLSGNTDRTFGGTITGGGVSGASDPVSGSGVLFKNGTGALTLTGSNSFLGGISLNTGRINIGNASALGQGRLYIMGGSIDNTSGAALSALTYNPAMTWSSSFTFVGTNSLTTLGTVTLANNPTVTVSANALTVGGVMSGSSSLTKAGNGTLVLSGDNTFIGGTTVSAGILLASGSSGTSNTGTGNVVVQNGATLGGTYRVGYPSSGTVTVNTGGIISPGNTTGAFASLRAIGNVNLNGTYTCDISGSSSDRLNVDGTLNLSGATLNLSGSTVVPPLIIASYGTLSGTFSTVNNMPFGYTLDYNYNNTSQIAVILIPSPSVSASISTFSASFNTTYGTASPTQSFSVNGSALTSNLVVTAPSGYQISTDNVNFFNSLSLSPSSGTVPATTVYARLTATAPAGNYNNEVFTVTSTGATTVNVNTTASGNVVNQKNLTISGISISNKTYDGNTTATITGTAAYIGLVNGESFAISGTPSAVFIDKNAGANKVVIISGYLAPSANYTITQPSLTADITRKSLTITSPTISARQYDGTTIAAAVTVGSLSGFIGIETVSATASAANYPSANVGTYSGISITYTLLDGTNGGLGANYILANGSASATIIPKVITISSPTLASRVYDGTTNPGTLTVGSLSGLVGSETLNVTGVASSYSSANVGSYTSNIAYTLSNGSGLASNYSLSNGSATGAITPKALSITSPSIASKVYDGTTAAGTLSIGTLSGLIGSETLNVGATASNYSSANVGSYSSTITYTLNNATGLASNYTLANGTASGSIVPKPLSITAPTIASKIYDATTTAGSVTVGTLFGFVGIETVTATGVAAAYASPNVGTYNNVVVTYTLVNGTNGGLAINYSLASGTSTGVITTRTLTITANDVNKQIGDILTGGSGSSAFTSTGLVGGQTIGSVTIAYGPAGGSTGQGATAGTYVGQVTPSAATGGTFSPSNYNITYVSGSIVVTNPNAVVLSNYGVAVCQDFNSLASSGTSSLTPSGWFFSESGSNANSTYTAGNGSTATGDTYSFGTGSDRTFGGLQSGSLIPTYGARIYNNTGATLNVVTISYTGKTWRVGASGRSDRIDFQYSTNATSLTTGTWTDENNLDYANPGQASTGNGSIQHSASITYTLQGLNIPQGTSLWIRWNDFDASGSDDGMGVDDVCITPIVPCTSPDLLVFDNQPTNVLQNATMSAVTVRAYCSSSGLTATGFNGNITLTASGGGCGYVSQTVAAVNGVATFNNIVFTRSPQTGITLTASGAGFSNLISNAFNVTAPAGGATTVAQQDFGSNTSLTYTTAVGGLGVFNTSNTRGVGSSNCLAFYYNDCLTGSGGSSSTATFSQSTGLTGLSNTKLTFAMAWGGPQLAGANCDNTGFTGAGLDVDDFIRLETRINGGAYVTTFQLNGNSNKQYTFSTSGVTLNHNANQTLSYASEPSAFTINLPAGTNSVDFRFTFKTNRRNEIIYLDNFAIQGNPPGSSLGLPTANAGITFNGCNGGPNQLQGSATQTVGTVSYSWMPSATLSDANISNPLAFNTTTTTYMLTITDGDNCSATSSVTVNLLSGTPGLWTGAENSDWFNCQNWASGNIPTSTVDVVIPDVTNDPDIASGVASCRNLTLSNPGSLLGMSGTSSQLNISGNVINNGSIISNGTVSFTGSSGQTITGVTSFQNLSMNNAAGLTLNNDVTVNGVLTLSSGNINAQTSTLIIASVATTAINRPGTGHIVGNLQRAIGLGTNTYSYPVGDISNYTPVTLALNNITSTGSITAKANNGDHPLLGSSALNAASSVNRYYTLTNGGVALSNYNATFEFVAGDLDFGTNTSNLLVGRYNSNWSYPAVGTLSATSAQALGVGGFGEFVLAECRTPNVYSVIGGGSYCAGSSGVAVGLSGSDVWATYQLRLNGVNIGSPVSGTGSSISFGNQTAAGTYSVVATNISSGACSQIQSGSVLITTETSLTPAVSITVSPSSAVCTATAVTFTATPSNGGATPTYVWRKNGVIVGGNSPTYSYSAPVNGDQIYVVMTSSSACVSPISATSNTIVITVTSGTLWYQDNDGDGYGSLVTLFSCTTPAGYVTIGGDCNDNNADVNPGVDEICNGIDDNCDGQIDEGLALSLYYQDLDSDGYGDASSSVFTCSMPMGYVTNNTDCNDNCSNCYPGASEIADGLDNNCNGAVDEGFGPANDMRSTALIAVLSNYYSDGSNCAFVNGTLLGATVSSEAFTGSGQGIVTGQDVWYYFTATQPGISIRVNSAVNNIAIELQTQTGSMVAWENYQSGIGNEVLNYAGLTVGQTYYIAVRNANSSQGVGGPFAMCVNMLQRGACGSSGGNYDLCGSLQANFTYANQYVFRFTDILNNNLYTYTAQSTYLVLAQVQGLLPGRTYSLRIDASYNLQRGDGSAQLLVVPGTATCSIGINAHTPMYLNALSACPNNKLPSGNITIEPWICAAVEYELRFEKISAPQLPITYLRGSTNRLIFLNQVNGLTPGTYNVFIRPRFASGTPGVTLPGTFNTTPSCLVIIGPAMLERDPGNALLMPDEKMLQIEESADANIEVYPNPSDGQSGLQLFATGLNGIAQVKIMNLEGQSVYLDNLSLTPNQISVLTPDASLPSGLYTVLVTIDNHTFKRKWLVVR